MKISLILLLIVSVQAADFRVALPGYRYEFPRDHFSHPDFQTEWWYYTGNLRASDGHRFGFELTFFRHAVNRRSPKANPWDVDDVYIAHLALSDLDGQRFQHSERVNRSGPGLAGIEAEKGLVWNGNWRVAIQSHRQDLRAVSEHFSLDLHFDTHKPPVIQGVNGVSQKGAGVGRASHYVSFTRLLASGSLELDGKRYTVTDGTAWMDHEFFTHRLDDDQTGWDWFALQFDDGTDLMLERLRRKDGSPDPFASGTYVDATGKATHLSAKEIFLEPLGQTWTSPITKATYPIQWRLRVPSLGLEIELTTPLKSQEIASDKQVTSCYWEGAVRLSGKRGSAPLSGRGYLEMTGYDKPVDMGH